MGTGCHRPRVVWPRWQGGGCSPLSKPSLPGTVLVFQPPVPTQQSLEQHCSLLPLPPAQPQPRGPSSASPGAGWVLVGARLTGGFFLFHNPFPSLKRARAGTAVSTRCSAQIRAVRWGAASSSPPPGEELPQAAPGAHPATVNTSRWHSTQPHLPLPAVVGGQRSSPLGRGGSKVSTSPLPPQLSAQEGHRYLSGSRQGNWSCWAQAAIHTSLAPGGRWGPEPGDVADGGRA